MLCHWNVLQQYHTNYAFVISIEISVGTISTKTERSPSTALSACQVQLVHVFCVVLEIIQNTGAAFTSSVSKENYKFLNSDSPTDPWNNNIKAWEKVGIQWKVGRNSP